MTGLVPIALSVNGRPRRLDVPAHHTLLDVLRDDLALTGTKECCLVGECGACTVDLDGRIVDSCLILAVEVDGAAVTTVEGLAADGRLSRLQQAFLDHGAAQCGFCIPGQLMAARDLLDRVPHPTEAEVQEGLAGNLCRCAGYVQITEAVLATAESEGAGAADAGREAGSAGSGAATGPPTGLVTAPPTGLATEPAPDAGETAR